VRWYPAGNDVNTEAEDVIGFHYKVTASGDKVREVVITLPVITSRKWTVKPVISSNPIHELST
jgi:hypothetical protein